MERYWLILLIILNTLFGQQINMQMFDVTKKHTVEVLPMKEHLLVRDRKSTTIINFELADVKTKLQPSASITRYRDRIKTTKKVDGYDQIYTNRISLINEFNYRQPEEFKTEEEGESALSSFIYSNYQILDLTYSLINANIDMKILIAFFIVQIVIRYFSFMCLVYLTVDNNIKEWWVFSLGFTSLLYFLCIVKISLKAAQTRSEVILKEAFNSLEENQVVEYFQVVSVQKLVRSMVRGLIPPEFSFFYIRRMKERRLQIYTMINFMYSSIEAVVYYPFFLIYIHSVFREVVFKRGEDITASKVVFSVAVLMIGISEVLFIILTVYLIAFGCKKKGYIQEKQK